jgi:biopolymer transport protein ExbD
MKFKRRTRSRPAALALTSMLDVIFLLLCFFVTASVFSQWESEISIQLPSAATGEQPSRLPGEIIVNLAKDGAVSVNGRKLTLGDLESRLARIAKFYPGQPVIIRADREVRYDALVRVIDTCRAADVWNFSLATSGEEESAAKKEGGR